MYSWGIRVAVAILKNSRPLGANMGGAWRSVNFFFFLLFR